MATDSNEPAKPEEPKGLFDKLGASLPVGLTALATIFASMSTSSLQRAMYWKSQAAQDQARVSNQWSYAGFKRDRALIMQTTASQLRATAGYPQVSFSLSSEGSPKSKSEDGAADPKNSEQQKFRAQAIDWLMKKYFPPSPLPEVHDEQIVALQKAIASREPEAEQLRLAARIKLTSINAAIDEAEKKSEQYDKEWDPVIKAATDITNSDPGEKGEVGHHLRSARIAAGYDLEERRYRAESKINQAIGYLYEIRVRVTSAESDRHRTKSEHFFYAMLAAQIGATLSALALAKKTKSLLWISATGIGLVSIAIGVYVYLEQ